MQEKLWVAHVKGEIGSYEVSVCFGEPTPSWGWFGRDKIRIEGGHLEDARIRAEKIATALNAAAFDPTVAPKELPPLKDLGLPGIMVSTPI